MLQYPGYLSVYFMPFITRNDDEMTLNALQDQIGNQIYTGSDRDKHCILPRPELKYNVFLSERH